MKIMIPYLLALPILGISINSSGANSPSVNVTQKTTHEQQRVQVDIDDLPEKVKASVGHNTELAWKILKAYLVTNPDQTTFYDLYVQKPDGETWMKVDKEGKVLN